MLPDKELEPWPLDWQPKFANPFFRDYLFNPNHKRQRVYDPEEAFAIVEQTPEELKMLEGTKKLDFNDVTNEELAKWMRWAFRNAPCVYTSNSMRKSFGEMRTEYPERRPYVIDRLLRQGEVANLISTSKVGKTFMVHQIAISVATGRRLFDDFQCAHGKVLIIDNELHNEEIPWRHGEVAKAMMVPPEYLDTMVDFISLRGRLVDLDGLESVISDISPKEYALVILDSLYRMMPPRCDENDNGSMARLYNKLDHYAMYFDAPIMVVHHASKGNQSGKNVVDVGAGAGAQSRACDLHIVLRQLEEDNCVLMEAATRSSPRIEPLGLRFRFPLWNIDGEIDKSKLKGAGAEKDQDAVIAERNAEKVTKTFVAKSALMGTSTHPPVLTNQLLTPAELRTKMAGSPWNIDIGEKGMTAALNILKQQGIAVCHRRPPGREFAWQFSPDAEAAKARVLAANTAPQPASAPAQPLGPQAAESAPATISDDEPDASSFVDEPEQPEPPEQAEQPDNSDPDVPF